MGNEGFAKIERELVADRTDKNPGVEQFVVCLPERMGKNAPVSLQVGFIGTIILSGQKVARSIVIFLKTRFEPNANPSGVVIRSAAYLLISGSMSGSKGS